jgi:hypothetical protein
MFDSSARVGKPRKVSEMPSAHRQETEMTLDLFVLYCVLYRFGARRKISNRPRPSILKSYRFWRPSWRSPAN